MGPRKRESEGPDAQEAGWEVIDVHVVREIFAYLYSWEFFLLVLMVMVYRVLRK